MLLKSVSHSEVVHSTYDMGFALKHHQAPFLCTVLERIAEITEKGGRSLEFLATWISLHLAWRTPHRPRLFCQVCLQGWTPQQELNPEPPPEGVVEKAT